MSGETLKIDANFRNAVGGVADDDPNYILNARIRKASGRILVETEGSSGSIQSVSLYFNEVVATGAGVTVSYGAAVTWVNFINDDDLDDVWIRLGVGAATTASSLAYRLRPGDVLDLDAARLPPNLSQAILTTLPSKLASVRVSAGLTL